MKADHNLATNSPLSNLFIEKGVTTWSAALKYVRYLPYGRNSNRHDLSLVVKEQRGSCSSKHALLKNLAIENSIPGIKLVLGIYEMNSQNTPQVAQILEQNKLAYIPEAHCYLNIDGIRRDFTFPSSDFNNLKGDIIKEIEIEANQVTKFKPEFHRQFLRDWISSNSVRFSFDELWAIREICIIALSNG